MSEKLLRRSFFRSISITAIGALVFSKIPFTGNKRQKISLNKKVSIHQSAIERKV
ncbi:MAG: hypothetical protein K9J12_05535 [Melioribacteraceae bacterium]|nr:hypothetical protein [Melioribacteraceae bacterium]MCF8264020.1 hypothetical protein [Melioribacteraceae bacterium]MCF8412704.1 hypothetical protein [Melioribacteraceae bacterium]MCF8432529.1 hypothetical protein [Melioribacteraceae bacterium]